ncbi:MAG: response regulator transcription factor [Bacteroidia bacterium]|jgi:two-component system LytT family response regulator|nr:response regulator transcription factor [Bacteroidia bacterium]
MNRIKTVLVDDERNGREILLALLEKFCLNIEVIGTADSAELAINLIRETKPNLVFLDINMPGMSGFEMLEKLAPIGFEVIFVTAHDAYALKAFKFSAIDYVLKPIDLEDLQKAVEKVEEKLNVKQDNSQGRYKELFHNIKNIQNPFDKLGLATRDGLIFVKISEIIRLESDVNYTWFFLQNGEKTLASKTLKEFEEMLEEYNFYRVHKSHLINLAHLQRYIKGEGGSVVMSDGSEVDVSRRNKEGLMKRLQNLS